MDRHLRGIDRDRTNDFMRKNKSFFTDFQNSVVDSCSPSIEGEFWEIVLITLNNSLMKLNQAFLLGGPI
jgi:hypothetical protein